jgi:glycosyltransferase involved in cell wall biosynthesis
MKARILQLIDSFDEGGSERQALQLTRLLHNSGRYQVSLACLKADGVLRSQIADLDLGEIPCYPLTSFYDANALIQLRQFVRDLRRLKIDVVHTHDFYTNIFGMVAGWLAGVSVRIASRRETSGMRSRVQQKAQRAAYALAHQIVANSEAVQRKLIVEGMRKNKITVIHNGFDPNRVISSQVHSRDEALGALGIEQNSAKAFVTIVANMRHEVKDYPTFLRAVQRVSDAVPDVGFLLAGEGELKSSLESLAAELGIANKAVFLGRVENIATLLSVSDVGVLASKAEGFSNSILEYMAAGCPVVATDVGGAREAIVEGDTGFMVASGDDEAMAERIVSLLRDPAKAQLMGQQGARIVERKFSLRASLQKTEALYDKLLCGAIADQSENFQASLPPRGMIDDTVSATQPAGACPLPNPELMGVRSDS